MPVTLPQHVRCSQLHDVRHGQGLHLRLFACFVPAAQAHGVFEKRLLLKGLGFFL